VNEKLRAKLAERGVDPEQFMQKLSQYVGSQGQAFATPQEYGQAIQQKKAAGQTLSDPETARIFESLTAPQRQTTTIPFPFGTFTPPKGVPGSNLMQAVLQHQQANPITIPYAPGTPTLATRQAEEAMRAQQAQEAFQREKFDWEKDMTEREFAAQQAYQNAQLALSRLKASGGGGSGAETGYDTPWGAVDTLIAAGASMDDVMEYVNHPANMASYKKHGVTLDQIRDYAQNKYQGMWQNVMGASTPPKGAAPADVSRGFRQLESYAPMTTGQTGETPRFSEADFQMFAEATGKTVEEIKKMDELGWLEDFMKKFYGYQYKPEDELDFQF